MRRFLTLSLALGILAGCRTGRNYPDAAGPRYGGIGATDSLHADADTLRIVSFNIEFARRVDSAIALLQSDSVLRRSDVVLLQEMDAVARDLGYAWPTESGHRTTSLGRWDHIVLKGLGSPPTSASGTVLDAYRISDHRPVWAIAILR